MALLILGAVVVICVVVFIFILNHEDDFVRSGPNRTEENAPKVIFLPDNLEKYKTKRKSHSGKH